MSIRFLKNKVRPRKFAYIFYIKLHFVCPSHMTLLICILVFSMTCDRNSIPIFWVSKQSFNLIVNKNSNIFSKTEYF